MKGTQISAEIATPFSSIFPLDITDIIRGRMFQILLEQCTKLPSDLLWSVIAESLREFLDKEVAVNEFVAYDMPFPANKDVLDRMVKLVRERFLARRECKHLSREFDEAAELFMSQYC
ncbi:MAG: hypothetical protein Kow0069_03770 [Promethearchaeota archaeon]